MPKPSLTLAEFHLLSWTQAYHGFKNPWIEDPEPYLCIKWLAVWGVILLTMLT